ncbi:MAG: substrate-binding domain-containing protein [Anaerolineae bacterium]|nr:substrate-binding domain-containing protein [Anaerolineae bacterium]
MTVEISDHRIHSQRGSRPTIGLLLNYINNNTAKYQTMIWHGIAAATRAMDVNLICFVGGTLSSPTNRFEFQRNVIYSFPNPSNVDGLIIVGSLGISIPLEDLKDFHRQYHPLPTISFDTQLEGIPSVLAEDRKGLYDAITHLIEAHSCRRVGFIQGPENAPGADERYRAYTDALADHDIPLDPNLVAPGDFLPESGTAAIDLLLEERQLRPGTDLQAMAAANDNMALAAMEALQQRGVRVPYDVAIVGFDDIEHCVAATPALTTVRQPIGEMARLAVGMLLALMSDEQVPDLATLPTKLMIRQSCGCSYMSPTPADVRKTPSGKQTLTQVLTAQHTHVLVQLMQVIDAPVSEVQSSLSWSEQLLDTFTTSLQSEGPAEAFLYTLDDIIRQAVRQGTDIHSWHEIVSILRRHTLPYLEGETLSRAIELWEQAWILIGEMATCVPAQQRLRAEQRANMLYDASQALITQLDVMTLMDVAARELPKLGIGQCYISLYENPVEPNEHSWLILAYDENGRHSLADGIRRYLTRELVPRDLLPIDKSYHLLVDSLYLEEERLGFVVFGVGALDGVAYTMLQAQISGALKGVFLLQSRKQIEQELVRSNQELEQFALAAFNGLQEPLRMVSNYLQLLERRYQGMLDSDADEFIQFAVDGASRMQGLISDLLSYARVETQGKVCKPTDCNKVLTDALTNLKIALEESEAIVIHDPLPTLMADDVQLVQLFQNLLSNAFKFRKKDTRPEVHVGVEQTGGFWQISVRDNGIGIDLEDCGRLFTLFQRLHNREEYPGTGIGLAICKKIVECYGGRIWFESEVGKGTTFYFTLPIIGIGST